MNEHRIDQFKPGDRVRIAYGMYGGFPGVVREAAATSAVIDVPIVSGPYQRYTKRMRVANARLQMDDKAKGVRA